MKLLKFGSSHCGPCKALTENMKEWNKMIDVEYVDIETDEGYDKALVYGIRSTPTLILLDDEEKELTRQIGGVTPVQIDNYLNNK